MMDEKKQVADSPWREFENWQKQLIRKARIQEILSANKTNQNTTKP